MRTGNMESFIKICIEQQPRFCTVETNRAKPIPSNILEKYNKILEPYGYFIDQRKCDVCYENTNGERSWHIERFLLEDKEKIGAWRKKDLELKMDKGRDK